MWRFYLRSRPASLIEVLLILALTGFLTLSGFAAFQGLYDLILAEQPALAIGQQYYIIGAVVFITAAMWVLLEVTLRRGPVFKRSVAFLVYVFLALWSVGFGYGFWWKVIASKSETRQGMEAFANVVQTRIEAADNTAHYVEGLLASVITTADRQQTKELNLGSSCGTKSIPGNGPFFKLRSDVTSKITTFKSRINSEWVVPLREILNGKKDAQGRVVGGLQAERNKLDVKQMRDLNDDQRHKVYDDVLNASREAINKINNLNVTQGKVFANDFNTLAEKLESPPDEKANCQDKDLARELLRAAVAAQVNAVLEVPEFEINEGPAATVKAFNKIWSNTFWLARQPFAALGLAPAESIPEPLKGRDVIALVASVAVDICILVFAFIRTRPPLDASYMFRAAQGGARMKLEAAIRAFSADDDLDARKVFNACILRSGRHYYFILPHLSSPMPPSWRPGAAFLQNILIVLEAVHAIDQSYETSGSRSLLRSLIPGLSMKPLFERAANQLREFGWGTASAMAGSEPSGQSDGVKGRTVNFDELSLHRFQHGDLLELLLLLRDDAPAKHLSPERPAPTIQRDASVERERWPTISLRRMRDGLNTILARRRERRSQLATSVRDERPSIITDTDSPGVGSPADVALEDVEIRLPTSDDLKNSEAHPPVHAADLPEQKARNKLVLYSDHLVNQLPGAGASANRAGSTTNGDRPAGLDMSPADPPPTADVASQHNVSSSAVRQHALDGPAGNGRDGSSSAIAPTTSSQGPQLSDIFGWIDDVQRAIDSAASDPAQAADVEGLTVAVRRMSHDLEKVGLVHTAEEGMPVDLSAHHIVTEETSSQPKGTILRVDSQGYRNIATGTLVREAKVVVSRGYQAPPSPPAK